MPLSLRVSLLASLEADKGVVMTKIWRGFASDNYAGVHPEVLVALGAVNDGHQVAYGDDTTTEELQALIERLFGSSAQVFPVFNGTGANVVALQSCTDRWEAVICATGAHINADEGGAPEKMAGLKLYGIETADGKLTPELIATQVYDIGFVHRAQPAVVSITQTTEVGTLYSASEVRAIADYCHANNLLLHMDGARLSNAAAALGSELREFTVDAGVDILSLGGTKIGALGAEAVVVFNPSLTASIGYLRKTSMQLASKMRFISAQLLALYRDGLAIRNGLHANAMAAKLHSGLEALGVEIPNPTQANAVFPIFTAAQTEQLQKSFRFYMWNHRTGQVRLMCSWDTTEADVDDLLAAAASVLGNK
jgi:threonine aldolase